MHPEPSYALNDINLKEIIKTMEEMAGAPAQRHIKQPGERNAYERMAAEIYNRI